MSTSSLAKVLCGLVLLVSSGAYAQFGYTPQGSVPPAVGQGLPPMGTPQGTLMPSDPNMGMGMGAPGTYVDPMTYGGQPSYQPQPNYPTQSNYMGQPGFAPMGGIVSGGMLTYGQLEVDYNYTDFDNEEVDPASGVGLSIMAELFKPFFLRGGFNWGIGSGSDDTLTGNSYNFRTVSVGGGAYLAVTQRFHIVGELGGIYSSLNADKNSLSFTDGAIYIHPQLRIAATDKLELKAGVLITSADNYDSRVFDIGSYYRLFTQMDVGLGADIGDQSKNYHLGVRFRW